MACGGATGCEGAGALYGLPALYWGPLLHTLQFGYVSGPEPESQSINVSFEAEGLGGITLAALMLSVAAFVRFSALFPRLLRQEDFQLSKFLRPLRGISVKLLNPAIVWGVAGGLAIDIIAGSVGGSGEDIDLSMVET